MRCGDQNRAYKNARANIRNLLHLGPDVKKLKNCLPLAKVENNFLRNNTIPLNVFTISQSFVIRLRYAFIIFKKDRKNSAYTYQLLYTLLKNKLS